MVVKIKDRFLLGGMLFMLISKLATNNFSGIFDIFGIIIVGALFGYIPYKIYYFVRKKK